MNERRHHSLSALSVGPFIVAVAPSRCSVAPFKSRRDRLWGARPGYPNEWEIQCRRVWAAGFPINQGRQEPATVTSEVAKLTSNTVVDLDPMVHLFIVINSGIRHTILTGNAVSNKNLSWVCALEICDVAAFQRRRQIRVGVYTSGLGLRFR